MIKLLKLLSFSVLLIILFSCNQNKNTFVLKGVISNSTEQYIYIQELKEKNDGLKDSFLMNSSGKFNFEKEIHYPTFYRLWLTNQKKQITLILAPGEKVKLTADAKNIFDTYIIKGSESSILAQKLSYRLDKALTKVDLLNQKYILLQKSVDFEIVKKRLLDEYNQLQDEHRTYSINLIQQNPTSIVSIFALYQQFSENQWVFYQEDDLKYFQMVDSLIFPKMSKVPYVLTFHANVEQMKLQKQKLLQQQQLSAIGAMAPEIALPSTKGDTIRLSSLKGKYVLVDFWASWCNPCRNENPFLVDIYNRYKYRDFEILQVSLDKSKVAWVYAIRKDKLRWKHVSDLQFWNSPIAKLYNVESIPSNFLIDINGFIIAKNLRGENLENKLKEIIDNTNNTTGR